MINIQKRDMLTDIKHRLIVIRTEKAHLERQEQSLLNNMYRIQRMDMEIPKVKMYDEDFKF